MTETSFEFIFFLCKSVRVEDCNCWKRARIGMSEWTAQEMAKDGKNYEEILQYFYEGTETTPHR